jgi:MscS family membrane protein
VTRKLCIALALFSAFIQTCGAASGSPADPLNRLNPRSTVTAFLQACHQGDYSKAAQYLDLSHIPERQKAQQGPTLARDIESLLNSASSFDALQLSQNSQGNLEDDPDPAIEHVTTVTSNDQQFTIELQRNQPASGPAIWVFSANTVAKVPQLVPVPSTESRIEARLPRFLVATLLLGTPLWKWIALLLVALLLFAIFRLLVRLFDRFERSLTSRFHKTGSIAWVQAIVDPLLVLLSVIIFRIIEVMIAPAALSRLYIGRALLLVIVGSFAWGLINLLDYLIVRLDRRLNHRQRVVSSSIIYLGRRTLKAVISIVAAILILDNWGFNMTTIIAGLGVGGIAVALAAQQTIANVFGGVSVIGDAPVMVGDFGNFGGVIGTVEDIGLRSARVRTLNRTVMSIPNSAFAGMNLENYAVRDKILFNPSFPIKRGTSKDQIRQLIKGLRDMLEKNKQVEIGPTPVRISAYSAASFTVEIFAYILTPDIDEYYKHQAELYLAIDEVVASSSVELA